MVRGRFATAYSPPEYKRWQEEAAEALLSADLRGLVQTFTGPVEVDLLFDVLRPPTTKLLHPKPDIDNYVKSILDVITKDGRFWNDDCQVVSLTARKRWMPSSMIQVEIKDA